MASLFRRQKDNKHRHSNYRVEDLRSNQTVVIEEHGVLVGDIYAPQVIVSGMVYGYVVAGEVIVEPSGQIWGDICATSVTAMPGSKVHGWVSSLDQGTVDLLRLGQLTVEEVPRSGEMAISAEKAIELAKLVPLTDSRFSDNTGRVEIWRRLRSEVAVAFSARIEIEQSFEVAVLEAANSLNAQDQRLDNDRMAAEKSERPVDGLSADPSEVAIQLSAAESEIRQLKTQLASALSSQSLLRNQLIWTKASLIEATRRQQIVPEGETPIDPDLTGETSERQLAELQAALVERDLKLEELQAQSNTQGEQLARMKTLAAQRIESLERKLKRIQGQH